VHGLLERMGEPLPGRVIDGDWWNEGRAVSGSIRLANGARWDSAWIQLLATHEYGEEVSLFFADSVRSLSFPSPWLKQAPTVYRRSERDAGSANAVRTAQFYGESFARELRHFHSAVTGDEPCRTPPEQARLDIEVLTQMFLASRREAEVAQG
jgi:myo-inositol 2-dehydrogenase/D-chiro-inositol 1-dehydrogenase